MELRRIGLTIIRPTIGMLLLVPLAAFAQTGSGEDGAGFSEGAFEQLSPGNQKIARAIEGVQLLPPDEPANGTGEGIAAASAGASPLTLDEIAAAKLSGQGWGEIFHDMQAQGLVEARNLGQAVSAFNHQQRVQASVPAAPEGEIVVTTAGGESTVVALGRGKSGMAPAGASAKPGHGLGLASKGEAGPAATALGVGGSGNGLALGHDKPGVSLASGAGSGAGGAGITSAGGGNAFGHGVGMTSAGGGSAGGTAGIASGAGVHGNGHAYGLAKK